MRKSLLLLSIVASYVPHALAQSEDKDDTRKGNLLSEEQFDQFYTRKITHAITGERNLGSLANFAAVNITKPTATVGLTRIFSYKNDAEVKTAWSALSVSGTGGFNENTVSIFSNTRLNSSADLSAKFSLIPKAFQKYWKDVTPSVEDAANKKENRIKKYYSYKINERKLLIEQYTNEKNTILGKYSSLTPKPSTDQDLLNSANVDAKDKARINELSYQIDKLNQGYTSDEKTDVLFKARKDSLDYIKENSRVSSVQLVWIDFIIGTKYQKYYTYNEPGDYATKLVKNGLTQPRYGIAINRFLDSKYLKWKRYWRVELLYARTNNTDQLQTQVINTIKQTVNPNNSLQTIQSEDQVSAYDYSKYRSYYAYSVRFDLIQPISKDGAAALHPYYSVISPTGNDYTNESGQTLPTHTVQDLGVGLLLSISDKDKKALVNFEPYFTLRDLADKYKQEVNGKRLTLLQRSDIGIRVAVPFGHFSSPM
ncbi:hypothetical protein [Hymenobacter rigui]|uniref:DUF3570 domain-containing protein n=1 Tax=Hymenobacter rigui TaxID=334424 RepID=A0A3R9MMP7_9BACT|nr:hypothetical protein [Hymenobacter rigui]RSK49380.1 hypothetical protein EI291_07760 [Hymenobacter rigui]